MYDFDELEIFICPICGKERFIRKITKEMGHFQDFAIRQVFSAGCYDCKFEITSRYFSRTEPESVIKSEYEALKNKLLLLNKVDKEVLK